MTRLEQIKAAIAPFLLNEPDIERILKLGCPNDGYFNGYCEYVSCDDCWNKEVTDENGAD